MSADDERKARKRVARRAWEQANPEKYQAQLTRKRELQLARVRADPEKYRTKSRESHAKNPAKNRARANAWRLSNPEKTRERLRAWGKANRDKRNKANCAWRQANPEKMREMINAWKARNPDKLRAQRIRDNHKWRALLAKAAGTASTEQVAARVEFFGGVCSYCGGPYEHLDHAIPLSRGGTNWPANLRTACRPCNLSKGSKTVCEFLHKKMLAA